MQMKTFLNNKKVVAGLLAFVLLSSGVVGVLGFDKVIAYAIGSETLNTGVEEIENQTNNHEIDDKAIQTKVEVLVKYLFKDGRIFIEEKIIADVGDIIDSGDLPMLPDDMEFTDDFLFYEVKESDNLIERTVVQLVEKDEIQEEIEKEDVATQTEISNEDIKNLEKKSEELNKEVEKLKEDLDKSVEVSKEQQEKIEVLEKEKTILQEKLEEARKLSEDASEKEESDKIKAHLEQVKAIEEKLNNIDNTLQETNKIIKGNKTSSSSVNQTQAKESLETVRTNQTKPLLEINSNQLRSTVQTATKDVLKNEVQNIERPQSSLVENSNAETQKDNNSIKDPNGNTESALVTQTQEKETEIRYPNKLTPKKSENSSSNDMSNNNQAINSNKGVASEPSRARASVTENVDNANNDFPIHHGTVEETNKKTENLPYYSADARQFVTFSTKNGKTFHLIINHDEDSENVMLLTEVSEDDLLNMVETKKEPIKEEPIKIEEPDPVIEEPKKEEQPSNAGSYLIVGIVIAGVLGAGYYFKVVKAKENEELEGFEEDDDYYYSEAEDDYIDSNEDEYIDDEEEDIDSEDLL